MVSYLKNNVQEPPKSALKEEKKYIPKVMVENKVNENISRTLINPPKNINVLNKSEKQNISIKTGLNDNTFINPVIQCFNNVSRFRDELINNFTLYNNKNKKLSSALNEALKNLKYLRNKCSNSLFLSLRKVINEMNPSIKEPKDLILFILDTVDEELNLQNNNIESLNIELSLPQLKDFNDFRNLCFKDKLSIIFYEFFGFIQIPSFCKKPFKEAQLKMLTFPIKNIKNNKNNNISIYDCFEYYINKNIDSSIYCNYCQKFHKNIQGNILYAPQTLIINLEWDNQFENEINFEFGDNLDLKQYINNKDSINFYELIGVISKNSEGRYIAYCKKSGIWNIQWYKYEGEKINICEFDDIQKIKCPIIFFYSFLLN
jgi:hypothetical protein